jgi:hypothetical protein
MDGAHLALLRVHSSPIFGPCWVICIKKLHSEVVATWPAGEIVETDDDYIFKPILG